MTNPSRSKSSSFVDANGTASYPAMKPRWTFAQELLRKIVASGAIVTVATKAAVVIRLRLLNGLHRRNRSWCLTPPATARNNLQVPATVLPTLGSCSTRSVRPNNPVRRIFAIASNSYVIPSSRVPPVVSTACRSSSNTFRFPWRPNIQLGSKNPTRPRVARRRIRSHHDHRRQGVAALAPTGRYGTYQLSLAGTIAGADEPSPCAPCWTNKSFIISQSHNACTASSCFDISSRTGDIPARCPRRPTSSRAVATLGRAGPRGPKWSDTTLVRPRVQPDSDQVYRVPKFYDQYDINRQSFEQQNLQQLTLTNTPSDGELNIR